MDPVLARCKLIAEPWDATGEGYRVGGFGVAWSEWNGRYRDAVRDFWRGHGGIGELASRLTGQLRPLRASRRRPWASVNFVTAHDGFTLRDLVSYEHKHNEANGENNRDGTDDNRSQNFGVEGETTSPVDRGGRLGTARALLGTLLLSTARRCCWAATSCGAPRAATTTPTASTTRRPGSTGRQRPEAESLTAFVARVTEIRRSSPDLHRDRFYRDGEVLWWHPSGRRMGGHDWHDGELHTARASLRGEWLLLLHAGGDPVTVRAAARRPVQRRWWTAPATTASPLTASPVPRRHDDHPPARLTPLLRTPLRGKVLTVPLYDFRCRECAQTFEVSRPMSRSRATPRRARAGHADTVKLLSTVAVAVGGRRSAQAPAGRWRWRLLRRRLRLRLINRTSGHNPPTGPPRSPARTRAPILPSAGAAGPERGRVSVRRKILRG